MKYSKHGYKRNSKDRNNPYNVIPSGNITMEGVDFPVMGTDNLGNQKLMMPGANYTFPGNEVFEVPLAQNGGDLPYLRVLPDHIYNSAHYDPHPLVNEIVISESALRDGKTLPHEMYHWMQRQRGELFENPYVQRHPAGPLVEEAIYNTYYNRRNYDLDRQTQIEFDRFPESRFVPNFTKNFIAENEMYYNPDTAEGEAKLFESIYQNFPNYVEHERQLLLNKLADNVEHLKKQTGGSTVDPYELFNNPSKLKSNNNLLFPEVSTKENPIHNDRNLGALIYYTPEEKDSDSGFFTSDLERMTPYLNKTYGEGNWKSIELPKHEYNPRYTELNDLVENHPSTIKYRDEIDKLRQKNSRLNKSLFKQIEDLQTKMTNSKDDEEFKRLDIEQKKLYSELEKQDQEYGQVRRDFNKNYYDSLETEYPDLHEAHTELQNDYFGNNTLNKYVSAKNIANKYFSDVKNLKSDGNIFVMQHGDSRIGPLTMAESYRDEGMRSPEIVDTFGEILLPESQGGWLSDGNSVVCYGGMCSGSEGFKRITEASGVTTHSQPGTWSGYQPIFGDALTEQFFNTNEEGIIDPRFQGGTYITHALNDGTVRSDTIGDSPRGTSNVTEGTADSAVIVNEEALQEAMANNLSVRRDEQSYERQYGAEIEEENQTRIPQGMLETVNVGPGGDAIEYYKERLPYYNTLSSDQRQHLNDVRLGKVPKSPIFRNIIGQGREGYGIGNNPTYMESVHDFAGAFPTLAGKNLLETLTIPQATLVEGIEAAKGNPYNFKNVLPTADKNLFSNQRFPSNTFLQDAPLGWQIAGDIGIDPAAIFGLGKLGQLGVRSLNTAARNRKLATTLSSTIDDALTTPTNYNTVSRPSSIFDGINPGFGQSDELVDDAYKAIGSIGEDKIYSTSQIGDLTVTNASKNLLTDMSNAANTGKFANNSFPQIGVASGKLNVPNKTQITKFDDALNTAFDYKGMEDGTNVALTRIIDSKGLGVENGKLTFKIAPHMEGSKEALKIQNYDDIIKKRNTTHFSFSHIQGNEYHGSHGAGDWRNKSTAVINNINDLKKHGELLNISPSDTYFYTKNNMFVGDQAIVLTRDKKLYDNITKNAPKTNIYYVGKNVTDDQFTEIVNSFHRTAGSSQDMDGLFHNYVGNELVAGRDIGRFKVSNKEHYLKDFSSDNPNTFSGGFAGHDPTHGSSLLSDLEKAANFKNLKYIGPELKYGVDPSGKLPNRQGTITDLSKVYNNPYLIGDYNPPGNIHHQSKLLNKYITYPEMKESPRSYKNWLKGNSFEELSNYPIEVQINEIEKLVSSGFDTKLLNTHKEWLALSNGFDTWTDMVAKSGYNTMKKYGGSLPKAQTGLQTLDLNYINPETKLPYDATPPVEKKSTVPLNIMLKQSMAESSLIPDAVSDAGAIGLTQVMPNTLKDYIEATGDKNIDLYNWKDAIKVQNWYMNDLYNASFIDKPNQSDKVRMAKTLAAYNWGRGHMYDLLTEQKEKGVDIYSDDMSWIKELPSETSEYLDKILFNTNEKFNKNINLHLNNLENKKYLDAYNYSSYDDKMDFRNKLYENYITLGHQHEEALKMADDQADVGINKQSYFGDKKYYTPKSLQTTEDSNSKKLGGPVLRKIKRIKQQLNKYKEGKEISYIAKKELINLGLIDNALTSNKSVR